MASSDRATAKEVKSWLEVILKDENLKNLSVNVLGNSEKGDGYLGDIVFVTAKGTTSDDKEQVYNLVLKCSKRSQALRDTMPIKEIFQAETLMYEEVHPCLLQFQKKNGIQSAFESYPKCYGSFTSENMEVIALENLKSRGYELWPKKKPLTRKHIDLVVTEYGKYHATSAALKQRQPDEYQKFANTLNALSEKFDSSGDYNKLFASPINEACELLKDDLDENTLKKWKALRDQVDYFFRDYLQNYDGLKIISHGDCWNNNFMYLHENIHGVKNPVKVALLDWQMSRESMAVTDLSYFLFTCLSKEDMENLEDILSTYHKSFVNHLKQFGIEKAETVYSYEDLLKDWKNLSRFGVLMACVLMKVVSTEKEEVVDITEVAECGKDFTDLFLNEIKDKDNFKNRIRSVIEYAVKHDLI